MSSISMSTAKKHLQSQGKEIVAKVYHRMKYEASNGVENLTDPKWRTAQAIGLDESTVTQILEDVNRATDMSNNTSKAPSKRKNARCANSILDDCDTAVLRQTIMSFPIDYKELPTIRKLKEVLHEKNGFYGCAKTLLKVLQEIGYEVTKIDDKNKALVEKHEIQMLRLKYLRQIQRFRDEERYVVFVTETGIDTKHIQYGSSKRMKGKTPVKKKPPKITRIILIHAGGCRGFIENAFLMYEFTSTNVDFQYDIDPDKYKLWMTEQLLPNLPENTVIVIGNASYHCVMTYETPDSNSSKFDMQTWLTGRNIPFAESMKKIELYDLIVKNKDKMKYFVLDELIRSKGFEVLRLPPNHPELNPIDKVWEIIKDNLEDVAGRNLAYLRPLINERIGMIDCTTWENIFHDVENLEEQYLQYFDMDTEFIVYANDSESDSDESD